MKRYILGGGGFECNKVNERHTEPTEAPDYYFELFPDQSVLRCENRENGRKKKVASSTVALRYDNTNIAL